MSPRERETRVNDADEASRSGGLTAILITLSAQFALILSLLVLNRFDSAPVAPPLAGSVLVEELDPLRASPPPAEPPSAEPPPEFTSPLPDVTPRLPDLAPTPFSPAETMVAIPAPRPPLSTSSTRNRSPDASVPVAPLDAGEVDEPPVFLDSNDRGQYPLLARRRRWTGTVWARILVDTEGRVTRVVGIVRTSGRDAFREVVLEVAPTWRFKPARHRGRPVTVWVDQPIRFELE